MENKTTLPEEQLLLSSQEVVQAIDEPMMNESDDWFLNQILDNTQPDFWWVY